MPTDQTAPKPGADDSAPDRAAGQRPRAPAARRALAEAIARRAKSDGNPTDQPKEIQGRGGLDPTRYGDWEVGGLASDF